MSGSAKYLHDEVYDDDWVRMTLRYHRIATQDIVVSGSSNISVTMCQSDATHVITEIKTGFNAYMLFESKSSVNTTNKQIAGKLKVLMQSMPSFKVEAEASVEINEGTSDIRKELKFKFYGDAIIDPPPATFEDAVEVYQSLPRRSVQF